nr:MAG TPA: hypothetical protein [Caudoviricetes sp.]
MLPFLLHSNFYRVLFLPIQFNLAKLIFYQALFLPIQLNSIQPNLLQFLSLSKQKIARAKIPLSGIARVL